MMSNKIKYVIISLGLGIVLYFINEYGIENIYSNLITANWQLAYLLLLWTVIYFFNSLSLKIILPNRGKGISLLKLFFITVSSYSINLITPFVSLGGEPYKIFKLKKLVSDEDATAVTLLNSMLHMLAHTFFWLIGFAIAFAFYEYSFYEKFILFILLSVNIFLIYFFFSRHKKGVVQSFYVLISKIKILKKLQLRLSNYEDEIRSIDEKIVGLYSQKRKLFFEALFYEFVARLLTSFEIYLILIAVNIDISFLDAVYITAAFSFIMNIIFFVPMEIGTRETSLFLIIENFSAFSGVGIFVAIVSRVREIFWIILGTIFIHFGNKKSE